MLAFELNNSVGKMAALLGVAASLVLVSGCGNKAQKSVTRAAGYVSRLVEQSAEDVAEVERGFPLGAEALGKELFPKLAEGADEQAALSQWKRDPQLLRATMEQVRSGQADLRNAKSTFFAMAELDGSIVRSDQQQDLLHGKNLFQAYPALKEVSQARAPVVTRGRLPEATAVTGRDDSQWVIAAALREEGKPSGAARAIFVSGWSWSGYAYRMDNAVRSWLIDDAEEAGEKKPVVYSFVVAEGKAYAAAATPEANLPLIEELKVLEKLKPGEQFKQELQLGNRAFGVVAQLAPALGDQVALVLLRSET